MQQHPSRAALTPRIPPYLPSSTGALEMPRRMIRTHGAAETPSPAQPRPQGPVAVAARPPKLQDVRARHVGSSEAAALFNLSPDVTRFELYLRKRGELPERDLSA